MKTLWHVVVRLIPMILGTAALDMASKALVEARLPLHLPQPVLGEWFRLTLVYNEGVAFGLFASKGSGVLILSGIATLLLLAWLIHASWKADDELPRPWILGLLLGGAVGNLIDRMVDGRVTDFLDFGVQTHRFATFNLADVFILVGMGLLILGSYRHRHTSERTAESTDADGDGVTENAVRYQTAGSFRRFFRNVKTNPV